MLSSDGRNKSFDAAADGYVRGEGAGALLVLPLGKSNNLNLFSYYLLNEYQILNFPYDLIL